MTSSTIGSNEVLGGGDDFELLDFGGLEKLGGIGVAHEEVVGSGALGVFVESEAGGGVGLRIAIDEEGWDAAGGEAGGEVDAGGGFPYSAFLVGDGNDPRHR